MFVLASKSPRRIEILKARGYQFIIEGSNGEEIIDNRLVAASNAVNIALSKALEVQKTHPNKIIVAADTIVVFEGEILGKPQDLDDALLMLKKLNNKKHNVITGVAIINNKKIKTFHVKSKVYFSNLTEQEINDYVNSGEPLGKAGSYAIQGLGSKLIKTFKGDYYNIMGLPIKKFDKEIKRFLR